MRLWIFLLLLAPQCFASKCKTCRGLECKNNSVHLFKTCTIFSSTVPFVTLANSDKELLDYGCLELEYSKGSSNEIIQKCVMAQNLDTICDKIAEKISYLICNVHLPIVNQDLPSSTGYDFTSDAFKSIVSDQESTKSDSQNPNFWQSKIDIYTAKIMDSSELESHSDTTDQSITYDIWGDSESNSTASLVPQEPPKTTTYNLTSNNKSDFTINSGLLVTTQHSLFNSNNSDTDHLELRPTISDSSVYETEETTINEEHPNSDITKISQKQTSTTAGAIVTSEFLSTNQENSTAIDLEHQQTETNIFEGPSDTTESSTTSSEKVSIGSNFPDTVISEAAPTFVVNVSQTTEFIGEKYSEEAQETSMNYNQDTEQSAINSWQDSSTVVESATRLFEDSTNKSTNSNIPGSEGHTLGDIPLENASEGEEARNPHLTSPSIEESNNWQDSSTVVEATTSEDWKDSATTDSNIPLGNSSKEEARSPDSTPPIEESHHWEDSSTVVEVTTNEDWNSSTNDSVEDSPEEHQNSNIPGTLHDLEDIPLENASKGEQATESDSTSLIGESNHWQDSSTVVKAATSEDWKDSSTTDSNIPLENSSKEEAGNPHSTPPIEESHHWQDSSTVVEVTISEDWNSSTNDSVKDSSEKHQNSNIPGTLDDLGDIPLENASKGEQATESDSTSPIGESNHWQDSSTVVAAATSEDWKDSPTTDSNIPLENSSKQESRNPHSTPPIEESHQWQDTSTVVEVTTSEDWNSSTSDSVEDSSEKHQNSNIPGTLDNLGDIPLRNASRGEQATESDSTSTIRESNHWQDASTVVEATTSEDWKDSSTTDSNITLENSSKEDSGNPHSTPPIEESHHWQDTSTVVEVTTSEDWNSSTNDSVEDSSEKPQNSNIPGTLDDLGDIPLENASMGEQATESDSTSTIRESNHWQDSSTVVEATTSEDWKDSSTTDSNIPLENSSKEEARNPHSTAPIEESHHWQDSSTVVEVTTSEDWNSSTNDSVEDSSEKHKNSNIPGTLDDLGDIPLENASKAEQATESDSTSTIREFNHWQDSSTVVAATTSEDWKDSSTTDSNIPLENTSKEESRNPHSTPPIEESHHWQDSATVVEVTTSEDWNSSTNDSVEDSSEKHQNSNIPGILDNLGDIPLRNASRGEQATESDSTSTIRESNHWQDSSTVVEATTSEDWKDSSTTDSNIPLENSSKEEAGNPHSTPPIEESHHWQDSSTVVEVTTSEDWNSSTNDSVEDSSEEPQNSNIPGTLDDLGDIPLENASKGEQATESDSTSTIRESNHWQDSSTVVAATTSEDWKDSATTDSNIPLENSSKEESRNPHSTPPIEESHHWQDSSTVVEVTTSEDWNSSTNDSVEDSPEEHQNSNIPGTLDNLGDIPLRNASRGEQATESDSTSTIRESNHWQDSSTVVEATTSEDWKDSSTTDSNIPLENSSKEDSGNPHSTPPIEESHHWQDSSTVLEVTISEDWNSSTNDSVEDSSEKHQNSNISGTLDDLGDIPLENASKGEQATESDSTSPIGESNHWQDSSTVVAATTSEDWKDSSTTDSNIPLENTSKEESRNSHSTPPIKESHHWQDSSTVVEVTTSKDWNSPTNDSVEDSSEKHQNSNIPGTLDDLGDIPLENASKGEQATESDSTSPIGESNHWQDSSTVVAATTSEDWKDSATTDSNIPLENSSKEESRNPHSTPPIEESHHWQDSSTVVEVTTSKDWNSPTNDSVEVSTEKRQSSNITSTLDDLEDIPLENASQGDQATESDSTSTTRESNHWQDSSKVVEATTSEDWKDSFTTDSNIPLENSSKEEARNPHSTPPIGESNHWQDSSTVVEVTTSKDWNSPTNDSVEVSTEKRQNSNIPGTLDDLGDIPLENASKEEQVTESDSTLPIGESNHWQDSSTVVEATASGEWKDSSTTDSNIPLENSSKKEARNPQSTPPIGESNQWQDSPTVVEATTSEDWKDSFTTDSNIPLENSSKEEAINPHSTPPIQESHHWQDFSTVVEATTSTDWDSSTNDSVEDSSEKHQNSNIPGTLDDLGDTPLENASKGEQATESDSTSPIGESNHWQDSSTVVAATTSEDWKDSSTTDSNIPLENSSKEEARNPHSTPPIEESHHWQDSSTVVEAITSADWDSSTNDSFEDSSEKNQNSNITNTLDDLGDIPLENASKGEQATESDSTSAIGESNHWQDSSTVVEGHQKDSSTTASLFDSSTQKTPNSNIPGTSSSPIEESNQWQDSSTVVEATTSKDWKYSSTTDIYDGSKQESPNSNIPGTEGHTFNDLEDIPLENESKEEGRNPDSTLSMEESNHWQDSSTVVEGQQKDSSTTGSLFDSSTQKTENSNIPGTSSSPFEGSNQWQDSSTVVEATTSKDWKYASTTDTFDSSTQESPNSNIPGTEGHTFNGLEDIPLENEAKKEGRNPDSTLSKEESIHWQDSSTVVEGHEKDSSSTGSLFDSSTQKTSNSNIPGTSSSPIEESNQWQDSSTVVEVTTSKDWKYSSTTDTLDGSTQESPNSNIPGTEGHTFNDLQDILLENESKEEGRNPDSTLSMEESNHWQDSATVVGHQKDSSTTGSLVDSSTQKTPNSNIPGTSSSPIEKSNHWQDSSTVVEATTSKDWKDSFTTDSFDGPTQKSSNSNIPGTEGHTFDDLEDIPLENESKEEGRNPDSTLSMEESNHWQDSSTVVEGHQKDSATTGSLFDSSTQKTPNSNIPGTSSSPIEESNQWQDSSTVVEATTSKDWKYSSTTDTLDGSTQESPNSNIPGTEGNTLDALGETPLENVSKEEQVTDLHSTSPIEESDNWQDFSTLVVETATSENYKDSFTTDSYDGPTQKSPNSNIPGTEGHTFNDLEDIPSENESKEEGRNPDSTLSIEESHHWQDSSTVVEGHQKDSSTTGSLFDSSTQKTSNSNIPGTSSSPIEESNQWQDSSTVVEATTSKDWKYSPTTDTFDGSTQESPNSNIPGTEGNTLDDLGETPLETVSKEEQVTDLQSTSPNEESSIVVVEPATSKDWKDSSITDSFDGSTQESPNYNIPSIEDHTFDDLGDTLMENASKEEEGKIPHSTPIEPNHSHSTVVVEPTTSEDWIDSNITSTEGLTLDDLGHVPSENTSKGEVAQNPHSASPIEESNIWQDFSTLVVETTTSKDSKDSSTTDIFDGSTQESPGTEGHTSDDISLENESKEEGINPDAMEESNHWQYSSTVVEGDWEKSPTTSSFDSSTQKIPTSSHTINDPLENASNSTPPFEEFNHSQDSSTVVATTTNKVSITIPNDPATDLVDTPLDIDNSSEEEDDLQNIPLNNDSDKVDATTVNINPNSSTIIPAVIFENPTTSSVEANETSTVDYENLSSAATKIHYLSSPFYFITFVLYYIRK